MSSLVVRNLRYFWRTNLGVVLGAACATAVLVGAMAVGDSVRLSLGEQAQSRIGEIDAALFAGDRNVRSALADDIAKDFADARDLGGTVVAPVLSVQGIARVPGGDSRAGIVDVSGVDERFFALSPGGKRAAPSPGKAFLDQRLAAQLDVSPGDPILLRIEKPSLLPRDMLMSTVDDISFALRLEVESIVTDAEFGLFSLRAGQVPPFNLFVELSWLQEKLSLAGRANLLLVGAPGSDRRRDAIDLAGSSLGLKWTLADMQLRVKNLGALDEMTSDRVFLDKPIVDEVRRMTPAAIGVLTYFVNDLRHDDRATPYSTVAAIGSLDPGRPPAGAGADALRILPTDLAADEIVLNQWIADDLQAKPNDTITLEYLEMGPQLKLRKGSKSFRVRSIIPMQGLAADKSLMPEFPGLHDSENCRDWEPGIPVDLDRIREKDEKYWDDHKGTPKAFLELKSGQALWANRYGNLTAIRGPKGFTDWPDGGLFATLDPKDIGLFFRDVRTPALAAGTSATDFGGLFLGLSFFLIGAALLLTSLLFVFGVEQRANEIGALLALGFRPARVRRMFLTESLVLATVGGAIGAGLGMGYTRAVLYGLGTLWRDAVGTTTLSFHAQPTTVVLGTVIAILVAVGSIAFALRRIFDRPAVELLSSRNGIPNADASSTKRGRLSLWIAIGSTVLALALVAVAGGSSEQAAGAFFGAGALLLIGALAACRRLLTRFAGSESAGIRSVSGLGVRNSGRRPGRSLATIALLASGTFLVVAVQANRLEPPRDASVRESGTGGFALFGRSTLPVLRDLGSAEGREEFGLNADLLKDVDIVPMRVREGDDASCLNLSLPQNPRLVGAPADALAKRGAFAFTGSLPPNGGEAPKNPWSLLDADYGEDVVPAIGDQASITWTLHKSLGDDIPFKDDRGRDFRVRIVGAVANSILQGNLVVSEKLLRERFPSVSGFRMFLIDAPADRAKGIDAELTSALEDIGLELTSTSDRLREFNAVQNTYLLIFQVLGGLGLLLGSVGVGMVVVRNALERRTELAVVSAVGFSARAVRNLVWSEHALLLGLGLASGVVAALLAVLPAMLLGSGNLSIGPMAALVGAVAVSGAFWVFLASAFATRGPLLRALQDD